MECNICFSEELGQAPCVVLQCNGSALRHVFHADCLKTRLEKGWAGAPIDFSFLKCPLCETRVAHPRYAALLRPYLQLEEKVAAKALERLHFEGMENDKAIVDGGGRFHGDARGFALHHFSFFQCFQCRSPYFAGARACAAAVIGGDGDAAAAAEIPREDLCCANCQNVVSQEACKTHGSDWLSFKCRFCCANAVWHCWVRFFVVSLKYDRPYLLLWHSLAAFSLVSPANRTRLIFATRATTITRGMSRE